jgi:hypothetical protein
VLKPMNLSPEATGLETGADTWVVVSISNLTASGTCRDVAWAFSPNRIMDRAIEGGRVRVNLSRGGISKFILTCFLSHSGYLGVTFYLPWVGHPPDYPGLLFAYPELVTSGLPGASG